MKRNILLTILIGLLATLALHVSAQRQKPVKLRVMTFNIRLENKDDGPNNWELRYQQVGEFLNKSKADIIGLQEVKQLQLNDIQASLTNYSYVGVARDDGKQEGEYNPIFYNKQKFNLKSSGTFWLSTTPTTPSKSWGARCKRIVTWAILQDKETFKSIVAVNTHFDHISDLARQNSAILLKERIGRMVNGLPVVLTGDLNIDDNDPTYSKITSRIFTLHDVWKSVASPKGPTYTFHDFGNIPADQAKKIDYIFVSPIIQVKRATIIDSTIERGRYLSDHNAHTADIVF